MKGLQILLIGLVLCCCTVRALPEVFVKSAFKLKRADRSLMDEMNSITAAINRSIAFSAPDYESLLTSRTAEDRNLVVKDDDGLAPVDRLLWTIDELKTYLDSVKLDGIQLEKSSDRIYGVKTEKATGSGKSNTSVYLFEALVQQDSKIPDKKAIVIQNWNVLKGTKNEKFQNNGARHFFCKHSLNSLSKADSGLNSFVQKCIADINTANQSKDFKQASFDEVAKKIVESLKKDLKLTITPPQYKSENSLLYRVRENTGNDGIEAFQLNIYLLNPNDEFINVDCTQIDHSLNFRVSRVNFTELDNRIKEELKTKLLSENLKNKLTIAKIRDLLKKIIADKKCSGSSQDMIFGNDLQNIIGREQGFVSLTVPSEKEMETNAKIDKPCFPAETKIGIMRYISGFMQIAHFRFQNKFLDYEFQIPCEEAEFEKNLQLEYDSILKVVNKVNKKHNQSSKDDYVNLPPILQKLEDSLGVVFDKDQVKKKDGFKLESFNGSGTIKVRFILKDTLYTIAVWHNTPGKVEGAHSTQISFQQVNSYDQVEDVNEQIEAFVTRYNIKP